MNEESQNINAILAQACANNPLSYRDFIEIALYHPSCGYYPRASNRVGRISEADFYTAESLGSVFSELVIDGALKLLGKNAAELTFIEIAAEPNKTLLQSLPEHPFKDAKTIRLGDPIEARGPVVIFANEWLDALPFHRLTFSKGKWQERGVALQNNALCEVLLPKYTKALIQVSGRLPKNAPEGYQFDWPIDAERALTKLLHQDWEGLLLVFDYGKPWNELLENCPSGTARTYHQHKSGLNLLKNPGQMDITCDVCWTTLEEICAEAGMHNISLESQEAFFVKNSGKVAEAIIQESIGKFSPRRQTLMELIHPAHMGRKFQVLSASRWA